MRPTRLSALLFSLLLLVGCATTSHVITGKVRTPIDPSQVQVYSTAPPNYEEIALIDATSRSSGSFGDQKKMDAVIERLKKEAASLGANGVLLQSTGSEYGGGVGTGVGTGVGVGGGGISIGTGIFTASDNKTGRGLAIHVPTPPQQ
jgi:hypothetical protein